MHPRIAETNITKELVIAACEDESAREDLIKRADLYIRRFLSNAQNRWSLSRHPYIYDFLAWYISWLWKNPHRLKQARVPNAFIMYWFKYLAWSQLVHEKKYQPKIIQVDADISDLDLSDQHDYGLSHEYVDALIDVEYYIAKLKRPYYINVKDWRKIIKIVRDEFTESTIDKSELDNGNPKCRQFAEILERSIITTIVAVDKH